MPYINYDHHGEVIGHVMTHDQVQQHSVTLRVGKLPLMKVKSAKFVLEVSDSKQNPKRKRRELI